MPNKGQIISFFIVLLVIIGGLWQAVSYGNSLKQAKELTRPAFVAERTRQQLLNEETDQEVNRNGNIEPKCQTEGCKADIINSIREDAKSAFVLIDDGSDNPKEFMLAVSASTTAFDLLQEASLTSGFAIESEEYDFGVFIEAINNKRNRQDNKYWLFYINKELSQLTPDKVEVNPGDKIEFIFTYR